MTFIRFQVTIPMDTSSDPSDVAVNTWHWQTSSLGTVIDECQDIHLRLITFYQAIDSMLSENLDPTAQVLAYNMSDALPRFPIYDGTIALTPGSTSLPNQMAIPLRYRAAYVSGVPRARRRGRLFLGPLAQINADELGDDSPDNSLATLLADSAQDLIPTTTGAESGSDITWQVYSPTTHAATGNLSTAMTDVIRIEVPNRFAVVRSRAKPVTSVIART